MKSIKLLINGLTMVKYDIKKKSYVEFNSLDSNDNKEISKAMGVPKDNKNIEDFRDKNRKLKRKKCARSVY